MELSLAHHHAVAILSEHLHRSPSTARAEWTWGTTIVLRVTCTDGATYFFKASGQQDVHTEARVVGRARQAGVPVVGVVATGVDDQLPGGRWMITQVADGESLQDVGRDARTIGRSLEDLADCYSRLHQVSLPGRGPLIPGADHGVFGSWSEWQLRTIERAMDKLGSDPRQLDFRQRAFDLCHQFAADLDAAPAALLHADLGDREVFVDRSTGDVTAIVDWGDALVGDPLYDLMRFVGRGPADDPRPARLHPTLHERYLLRNPQHRDRFEPMMTFYRFHICVVEAAWEPDWAQAHLAWAEDLMRRLS